MPYNYYYLDDDQENVNDTIEAWNLTDGNQVPLTEGIQVQSKPIIEWDAMIQLLTTDINNGTINGLLLDWKLSMEPNSNTGIPVTYDAEALAQQLRRLSVERQGNLNLLSKDIPIVLCSDQNNFQDFFRKEMTGHDLFDAFYDKDSVNTKELVSLAKGYQQIQAENTTIQDLLGIIANDQTNLLDARLLDSLEVRFSKSPHEFAHFLLKEVIEHPSVLLNEDWIAARLGIDKNSPDWNNLKNDFLAPFKYQGIFGDAWERWWWNSVNDWWEIISEGKSLSTTDAIERVSIIKTASNLEQLIEAPKLNRSRSSQFWVICKVRNAPLDNTEGLLIAEQTTLFPWQEPEYISELEAVQPTQTPPILVDTYSKDKLKRLRQRYEQEHQRTGQ